MNTATVDVVVPSLSAGLSAGEPASVEPGAKTTPFARFKKELSELEQSARTVARRRLSGSKLGGLVDCFPGLVEDEVDALLGKVGLVRKARVDVKAAVVEGAPAVEGAVEAAAVEAPAADVAVVEDAPKSKKKKSA